MILSFENVFLRGFIYKYLQWNIISRASPCPRILKIKYARSEFLWYIRIRNLETDQQLLISEYRYITIFSVGDDIRNQSIFIVPAINCFYERLVCTGFYFGKEKSFFSILFIDWHTYRVKFSDKNRKLLTFAHSSFLYRFMKLSKHFLHHKTRYKIDSKWYYFREYAMNFF